MRTFSFEAEYLARIESDGKGEGVVVYAPCGMIVTAETEQEAAESFRQWVHEMVHHRRYGPSRNERMREIIP